MLDACRDRFRSRYLRQAALAAEVTGPAIELHQMSVYEIARPGRRFDLVLFMGVLYHLRHPLLALDLIRRTSSAICWSASHCSAAVRLRQRSPRTTRSRRRSLPRIGGAAYAVRRASLAGDPTNWWVPNAPCTQAMLRSAGFRIECRKGTDSVCRCAAPDHSRSRRLDCGERASAVRPPQSAA